ncbi:MAG: OpgC domain-containing protein [Rhizobiales bacterium]|nr:OpgC domain-containing protein [Hyphomicrobiales bacterium]
MGQAQRDHRVDFLRGLALASIFINHVPGNVYEKLTHRNFGFSDAAEIFVLLAGFASAYAYFARYERGETFDSSLKALKRSGVLYMSHVVTTVAAIALFCVAAVLFAHPGYLDDSIVYVNIKSIFEDPVKAFPGLIGLGHQLGYFNILPMYMVILAMLPVMMWLAKRSLSLLLGCSIALYLVAGWFVIDMPNFPKEGGWFFNPFAWQILFVVGFILGQRTREGKVFAYNPWLFWASVVYLIVAFIWTWFGLWGYQPHLPIPKTLWDFDKTYVAFPRLFHVLALAYVVMMSPIGTWMKRIPSSNPLTALGRHSLPVFCIGSLLSMTGAILRYETGGGFVMDTLIIAAGLGVMIAVARFLDARKAPPARKREALTVPAGTVPAAT